MNKYDYLIVGSGLFGATFANLAKNAGKSCFIIEKRNHIAGNIYTENINGINAHIYGPHIFHTSNKEIWNYVNKFVEFNSFINRPKVQHKENLYSFPINLFTLYQLWGVSTPDQAKTKLEQVKIQIENPSNLEEWILSQVGSEIYEKFIYGYTKKQWGTEPKNLPSFIIKRLPIRLTFDDNYYEDTHQGIPIGGYTKLIEKMVSGITIEKGIDFNKDKQYWINKAHKVIYTGAIDEIFDYEIGTLNYRSLKFEHQTINQSDFQGNAIINFTEEKIPYTRIIEHKHFENTKSESTVITKETPDKWQKGKEKYYPINNSENNSLYEKYKQLAEKEYPNIIFGGRLATYKYLDMHQVIGSAFHKIKTEKQNE